MEFYGNMNNKRLALIDDYKLDCVNDPTTEIGFIYQKGMLLDYVLKWYECGKISVPKKVKSEKWEGEWENTMVPMTPKKKDEVKGAFIVWTDKWKTMKKIKRNKEIYYIGEWQKDVSGRYFGILKEMPRIANDDNFNWKLNDKYDTLEATIKNDAFTFVVIVKPNGNALIDVRYTKCENKHKNNVTLAQIDVYNASNQDILDAINMWKNMIRKELFK